MPSFFLIQLNLAYQKQRKRLIAELIIEGKGYECTVKHKHQNACTYGINECMRTQKAIGKMKEMETIHFIKIMK